MFLESLTMTDFAAGGLGAGMMAVFAAFILFFILLGIAVYIYMAFAFMAIARKVKYPNPAIAWVPLVGPALITSKTAKMSWLPILLIIGFFIPFIGWICGIAFMVFWTIWLWRTFEALGRPGWWAVLCLINILLYVFIGIAAWSDIGKEAAPAVRARRK